MGRHSAPADDDEDLAPEADPSDAAAAVSVATLNPGRHSRDARDGGLRDGGPRPRPARGGPYDDARHDDARHNDARHNDAPSSEGLAFLDDALGSTVPDERALAEHTPDEHTPDEHTPDDDLTIKIPLVDLARHDRPLPEEVTARIAPITDAAEPPPPTGAPAASTGARVATDGSAPSPRGAHATRNDLALVKAHGDVRARVLAAALVPFVVYVAVFAVLGSLTVHNVIWIWAPAIVAGVLVGLVLDAGHRHYPAPAPSGEPARSP